ncbi:sortase A [Jatrophihabitans sp. GAS493]|nr:sortase A [Jatrophihabitans sp. GAS493]
MFAISALALWLIAFTFGLSSLQASRSNAVLYSELRENLSGSTTPIGGLIAPGTPIALLKAPAAGLSGIVVVEGTSSGQLTSGPGHRRDTPLPGQAGTSLIYGRSLTYGAPFAHIDHLHHGDQITVTTDQGTFTYVVEGVRHPGDPLPTLLATGAGRLTLETSSGVFGSANTVYVDATLKGAPAGTPSGRMTVVPPAEKAMGTDSSGLVNMIFWMQALLVVSVAMVWAWVRWGHWQAWVLGVPAIICLLWLVTADASLMLPNLI